MKGHLQSNHNENDLIDSEITKNFHKLPISNRTKELLRQSTSSFSFVSVMKYWRSLPHFSSIFINWTLSTKLPKQYSDLLRMSSLSPRLILSYHMCKTESDMSTYHMVHVSLRGITPGSSAPAFICCFLHSHSVWLSLKDKTVNFLEKHFIIIGVFGL